MKSYYYVVAFYAYQMLLFTSGIWGCDNHDLRQQNNHEESDSFEGRHLRENTVEACGFVAPSTEELEEDLKNMKAWAAKQTPSSLFARSTQIYSIPVYIHVIQTSSSTDAVSDKRIGEYITYMNDAYTGSSAPFSFVLQAVTRTVNPEWDECDNYEKEMAMKRALKVGGANTLNVYICKPMYTDKGAQLTGFATRPYENSGTDPRDGVVIDNSSSTARLNTLVHEVGHFLGLLHTFAGETCDSASKGDYVDDTPQHLSMASTVNCNSDPSTWDTCPKLPGIDPVDNYMTYSNNNLCRTRFTTGQNNRMLAQYELYRKPKPPVPPAPRPTPVAPRPVPTAPRPTPVAPRPVPTAPRPTPVATRPAPTAPRPTPVAPRPVPLAPRPTPVAPRPVPTAPRPTPVAPRPAPTAPRPTPIAPQSIPKTPRPRQSFFAPRPPRNGPRPGIFDPRPAENASKPTPVATQSIPTAPIPTPVAPQSIPTAPRQSFFAPRPPGNAPRPGLFDPRPPQTVQIPHLFAPRPPQPVPISAPGATVQIAPTSSCAPFLSLCTNTTICCSGSCKPSRGAFGDIIGGRCFF